LKTDQQDAYLAERVILAAGVKEIHPPVPDLDLYYGKSIFSCPYCDGWEHRDQPLVLIAEKERAIFHMTKLIYNWSNDLIVATNGNPISMQLQWKLTDKNITVITEPIQELHGEDGYLQGISFLSGLEIKRSAGFVTPKFIRSNAFAEQLDCELKEKGIMVMDGLGRTTQKNVYSAGEFSQVSPSALILAAADGCNAAFAVNADISSERF
jgi:thioredoxin reductase (NADPH)